MGVAKKETDSTIRVSPILHETVSKLLADRNVLFSASQLHRGPTHILLPQLIDENCRSFQEAFDAIGLPARVYYAAKANNAKCLLRHVLTANGFVDVASEAELARALEVGFVGAQIECTGPKNQNFLLLALRHQCLISVDSLHELELILSLRSHLRLSESTRVLVRIGNPTTQDRKLQARPSKFGVRVEEMERVFELIGDEQHVRLEGFHFHKDGYDAEARAGFVSQLLDLIEEAYERGCEPTLLNVGGAWRTRTVEDINEWSQYVDRLEHQVISQDIVDIWGRDPYGLTLNSKGRISGREKALQKVYTSTYARDIEEIFSNASLRGQSLVKLLREAMFTVIFEPGYALLQNVGVTVTKVVGTKEGSDGRPLVAVEANPYNLSVARMFELVCDPVLVPQAPSVDSDGWSGFIVGNLCLEDDVLMRRRVHLPGVPKAGDLLCFINTAPYFGNFEDASPILQPRGETLAAIEGEAGFSLFTDDSYYPELPDVSHLNSSSGM